MRFRAIEAAAAAPNFRQPTYNTWLACNKSPMASDAVGGGGGAHLPAQVMLDKKDSGSKLQTQLPVFISWRSSGREAGEKQPLEATRPFGYMLGLGRPCFVANASVCLHAGIYTPHPRGASSRFPVRFAYAHHLLMFEAIVTHNLRFILYFKQKVASIDARWFSVAGSIDF
jgi:hypothetical protein